MKKETKKCILLTVVLLAVFVLWTLLVCFVDVKPIGPQGSTVGFATLNAGFHNFTGVRMWLYTLTDWLGLVPIAFIMGFALLGLIQWITRKSLRKVDYSIFVLGGFYVVVMAVFVLFEMLVVNHRPVLIEGRLEASYPSSTTLLVMCVMPTAIMQLNRRIKNRIFRRCVTWTLAVFAVFMVVGRLISGVHWLSDIVGGALLSAGLVMLYASIQNTQKPKWFLGV
jgi:undecaprenyl-diphosphatase